MVEELRDLRVEAFIGFLNPNQLDAAKLVITFQTKAAKPLQATAKPVVEHARMS